ncbi:recombinase family protein [Thalassobacillus sp. B23F22_16]|uniref:recombinase family protein n=1 Tax=Thalassobacillus sp. B23F22_16 TaxID=3459513 RepID=UPI00373F6F1A
MIIGYARVSSKEQNLSRQVQELKKFGCDKIYQEKQSGKNFKDRSIYNEMRSILRFNDVLVVHDLSRFGRNKEEIMNEWEYLTKEKEVDIVVLNMRVLDTRQYKNVKGIGELISNIVLELLSWLVDEERERIRQAQREGIEIAKKQGKYKGRPLKYHANATGQDKIIYDDIINRLKSGQSVMDIHLKTEVSRNTIYRIKKDESS